MNHLKGCPAHDLLFARYHELLDNYTAQLARLGKTIGFAAAEIELAQLRDTCITARHELRKHEEEHSCYAVAVSA